MAASTQVRTSAQRTLHGADGVAALLMTMGKPAAARLMKHFEPEEIKLITRAAAELKPVASPQIEALVEDFAGQFAGGAHLVGTANEVRKMLEGVLPPEQISEIMADLLGSAGHSMWDRVSAVPDGAFAEYLTMEHPQVAALILSKVKAGCAAKAMSHMPQDLRNQLMRRMLALKPVGEAALRIVEQAVQDDLLTNSSRSAGDPHAKMADIINKMERNHIEDALQNLAATRPKSAEVLKNLLFSFEDLTKLTPKARTTLFDKVPNEKVVVALKGTDAEFRDVILQALGARVRRMVEQELTSGEPAPQREVSEARRAITELALEMAGRGEIELHSDGGGDAYLR